MADDKNKQDGRDDARVDQNDASEVAYAAKQFGVTSKEVKDAIAEVGPSRAKLKAYFENK